MTDGAPKLGYRPALDGMRAGAIILVVASHVHPTLFKGGSLGVDIFFALTGFLITTLIQQELAVTEGRYAFGRFYARRSLRLFPALYATVAFVAVYLVVRREHLGEFLLQADVHTPYPWTTWAKFLAGAATYTTDLIGVTGSPGNLVGHTWSLAVEEQFYLVFPMLLVYSWRRGATKALMVFLGLFLAGCLAARLAGAPARQGFLWTRPESIACGSLLALIRWHYPAVRAMVVRFASPIVFVCLPTLVLVVPMKERVISGPAFDRGLLPVYGAIAAITIWAIVESPPAHPFRRILEWRPVVYLGTISYGLYLWHFPIFRMVTWEAPELTGPVNMVLKTAIALAVAMLSARFVEKPFRDAQSRFRAAGSGSAQEPGPSAVAGTPTERFT
jgi:peptidoglycan/LPS O-acetylase OafA/YrhL